MKRIVIFYLIFNLITVAGIIFLLEPPKMELSAGALWFCLTYTSIGVVFIWLLKKVLKYEPVVNKYITLLLFFLLLNATVFFLSGEFISKDFLIEAVNEKWNEGTYIKLFFHVDLILSFTLAFIPFKKSRGIDELSEH